MASENIMFLFQLLSGLSWAIAYYLIYRQGKAGKTYGMPIFALSLNIVWEIVYLSGGILQWNSFGTEVHTQTFITMLWLFLDALILYTFFLFAHNEFGNYSKPNRNLLLLACFVGSILFQIAFLLVFDPKLAAYVSAFAQNFIMSVLFIRMLRKRSDLRGQSSKIALFKLLGTLLPTISVGILAQNIPILILGMACFLLDSFYLVNIYTLEKRLRSKSL